MSILPRSSRLGVRDLPISAPSLWLTESAPSSWPNSIVSLCCCPEEVFGHFQKIIRIVEKINVDNFDNYTSDSLVRSQYYIEPRFYEIKLERVVSIGNKLENKQSVTKSITVKISMVNNKFLSKITHVLT